MTKEESGKREGERVSGERKKEDEEGRGGPHSRAQWVPRERWLAGHGNCFFALDFAVGESLHTTLPSPLNLLRFFSSPLQAFFFRLIIFVPFLSRITRKIMRQ